MENASTNSQALLDGVADGTIDYTIADSTEFALAHDVHPDLRIAFDIPGDRPLAWAASSLDPSFARDMTEYFARLKLDGELATIVNRYYGRSDDAEFVRGPGFMRHLQSRLPLYKQWFVEAAEQSSQDWRLLAAIGYQESKWNPSASSSAGARGLMQLTAVTANETKVTDLSDARQSIFGGARYFRQVYEKIPSHVPEPDRTWFALAAYNIGYGHVEDARVLAQKAGRDPDSWQDQQTRGLFAAYSTEYVQLMRKPRLTRQIDDAAAGSRLCIPCAEYYPRYARVQHGPHAHDTGLQCCIQRGCAEPIILERQGAGTQCNDLRMRGRIMARNGLIPPLTDDFIVQDQQRADRYFALFGGAPRKKQRALHEIDVAGRLHGATAVGRRRPT